MEKHKQEKYIGLLKKERERTASTLEMMDGNSLDGGLRDSTSELSTYDNHPADIASETFEMEKNISLRANTDITIRRIDKALDKIKNNEFGKCEVCGEDILEERLDVLPYAEACVDCSEKIKNDLTYKMYDRPSEEDLLEPPFGRTFTDSTDNNSFDGEDAWQAVIDFNDNPNDPSYQTGDNQGVVDRASDFDAKEIERLSNEDYNKQLPE
jgi:YteA family regulatory protein